MAVAVAAGRDTRKTHRKIFTRSFAAKAKQPPAATHKKHFQESKMKAMATQGIGVEGVGGGGKAVKL